MSRDRDADRTRALIQDTARSSFGAHGFERTTIRAVAAAAGVDPALVMHYFASKHQLFTESVSLELPALDLRGVDPDAAADHLVPVFLQAWQQDGPFMGMIRAAATHPPAAQALLAVFTRQVAPMLAVLVPDEPELRASLIGSQLIGLAVTRTILQAPPLVALPPSRITAWLRPVIAHYLSTPLQQIR